jgi:hypothetical protein
MFISQVVEALPPLVYVRRGELVIQFDNPSDLVWRVGKLSAILTQLEQESARAADGKNRSARAGGRGTNGAVRGAGESDPGCEAASDGPGSERQPTA